MQKYNEGDLIKYSDAACYYQGIGCNNPSMRARHDGIVISQNKTGVKVTRSDNFVEQVHFNRILYKYEKQTIG